MDLIRWRDNNKTFLIENNHTYSYDDLYQALIKTCSSIHSVDDKSGLYILESAHSFLSYVNFLAYLRAGYKVMLCSKSQMADLSYLQKISLEANENFYKIENNDLIDLSTSNAKGNFKDLFFDSENSAWSNSQFIVRTSGSSGKKFKLVLHSLDRFIEKYNRIGPHFDKTYAFSPFESIAGIETLLEVLTHERILVSGNDNLSPEHVVRLLTEHSVDYFQTTPTYMNLLIFSGLLLKDNFKSIRKIAYGSEPSQNFVVNYFKEKLNHIELIHTYGMSEIGIQKTITNQCDPSYFLLNENFNKFKIQDDILHVQSMTKMIRYLNDDELPSPYGQDWFQTNDIVSVEADYLKVLGRNNDLINVAGKKFFPSELEDLIRAMPEVLDVTISSEENSFIGTAIRAVLVIEQDLEEDVFRLNFKKFCEDKIINYMRPHKIKIEKNIEISPRVKKMRKL